MSYIHDPPVGVRKEEVEQIIDSKLKSMEEKIDKQTMLLFKIASVVSKMYQDGEINKDTFNKLDAFLKDYYDNPYKDGNY